MRDLIGETEKAKVYVVDNDRFEVDLMQQDKFVSELILQAREVESLIHSLLTGKAKSQAIQRLSHSILSMLTSDEQAHDDLFYKIKEYILSNADEKARLIYVVSSILATLILSALTIPAIVYYSFLPDIVWLLTGGLGGA